MALPAVAGVPAHCPRSQPFRRAPNSRRVDWFSRAAPFVTLSASVLAHVLLLAMSCGRTIVAHDEQTRYEVLEGLVAAPQHEGQQAARREERTRKLVVAKCGGYGPPVVLAEFFQQQRDERSDVFQLWASDSSLARSIAQAFAQARIAQGRRE